MLQRTTTKWNDPPNVPPVLMVTPTEESTERIPTRMREPPLEPTYNPFARGEQNTNPRPNEVGNQPQDLRGITAFMERMRWMTPNQREDIMQIIRFLPNETGSSSSSSRNPAEILPSNFTINANGSNNYNHSIGERTKTSVGYMSRTQPQKGEHSLAILVAL